MKSNELIQPLAMSQPIANEGLKFDIPEAATGTERASIAQGFPEITMQSLNKGGKPPRGQDCNGMFYLSTDQRVYTQNGGVITFNQSVSDAIGGYPKNAILDYINVNDIYYKVQSLIEDNTYNFVTNPEYLDDEHWKIVTLGGGGTGTAGLNLFDMVVKDHVLTFEESKGYALQGTYVYKTAVAGSRYGYPDFYNKCLEEFQDAVQETITCGNYSFSGYKNLNGHIFYNISDKGVVDAIYSSTGAAWYYGIDTENERIFLPRNDWFFQNGNAENVGKFKEAGLPNITGRAGTIFQHSNDICEGAFSIGTTGWDNKGSTGNTGHSFLFDASRSNPIYGNSNTVQPPAVKAVYYMVVGNTGNVTSTTVELTSESAVAPISFDTETGAVKLNYTDGLSLDSDGNLTGLTVSQAANAPLPSNRYTDLIVGDTGSVYTAPADGWFFLNGASSSATNPFASFRVNNSSFPLYGSQANVSVKGGGLYNLIPVQKNMLVYVMHNNLTVNSFRFIYAEGVE